MAFPPEVESIGFADKEPTKNLECLKRIETKSEEKVKSTSTSTSSNVNNNTNSNNNSNANSNEKDNDEINFKPTIIWENVLLFSVLHLAALYGVYCCFYLKKQSFLFLYLIYIVGALGVTAGAHRLWSHRSYKAKLPLRIFLCIGQTLSIQRPIYEWCRDHRIHHKHTETDADPHNVKRGFFFAHIGWLLMKKHPAVLNKGAKIPLDDLLADPVVYYQKKFYEPLAGLICFIIPTLLPVYLWNENIYNAFFVLVVLRITLTLHIAFCVNSVSHMWGFKPYDKKIRSVENILVSIGAIGEGFHNYHHTFPRDYSTSEFGMTYFNLTKGFIDFMSLIGQAYDRVKISPDIVMQRRKRTGDLALDSHSSEFSHDNNNNNEHEF